MSAIKDLGLPTEDDTNRQILDISKEIFTPDHLETKSVLTDREIGIFARALWFGDKYGIPEINLMVRKILLLKRSKGGKALKGFVDMIKSISAEIQERKGESLKL